MTDIAIRPAGPGDAAACAAIYGHYVTQTWVSFETDPPDEAEMAGRIAGYGASHAWLIAQTGTEIAGYAYGSPHAGRCSYASSCDVSVYLAPTRARQGIGTALYDRLLPILAEKRHAAFAGIALPNPGSIALHEKFGFRQVGIFREIGWKFDAWRDVGWWQRLL